MQALKFLTLQIGFIGYPINFFGGTVTFQVVCQTNINPMVFACFYNVML